MVKDRLKANAVPIQLPIGTEDTFRRNYRLSRNESRDLLKTTLVRNIEVTDIPDDLDGSSYRNGEKSFIEVCCRSRRRADDEVPRRRRDH